MANRRNMGRVEVVLLSKDDGHTASSDGRRLSEEMEGGAYFCGRSCELSELLYTLNIKERVQEI